MLRNKELIKFIKGHYIILIIIVILPLFLNVVLQLPSLFPIVSDAAGWLQFWPMYFSSIASFVMIYFTAKTLIETQRQNLQLREDKREAERARLLFDVIISQSAYFIRITNVGKENAYNVRISVDDEFLNNIPQENIPIFTSLTESFAVLVGKPVYLLIGFCDDINELWKDKNVTFKVKGKYNNRYVINECIDMFQYINKLHFIVEDELTSAVKNIKKGLIVPNDQYYPIQESLHIIAKHLGIIGNKYNSVNNDNSNEPATDNHEPNHSV